MIDWFEDEVTRVATESEAIAEYAHNAGMDNPDRAWLLTSYDTWVANPFYKGPPVRHPEDDSDLYEDAQLMHDDEAAAFSSVRPAAEDVPVDDTPWDIDDLPF